MGDGRLGWRMLGMIDFHREHRQVVRQSLKGECAISIAVTSVVFDGKELAIDSKAPCMGPKHVQHHLRPRHRLALLIHHVAGDHHITRLGRRRDGKLHRLGVQRACPEVSILPGAPGFRVDIRIDCRHVLSGQLVLAGLAKKPLLAVATHRPQKDSVFQRPPCRQLLEVR